MTNPEYYTNAFAFDAPGVLGLSAADAELNIRNRLASGQAVELPNLFEYGLNSDPIFNFRGPGSLADLYQDLRNQGATGGIYDIYRSEFALGAGETMFVSPTHVHGALLESMLRASQGDGNITVSRRYMVGGILTAEVTTVYGPDGQAHHSLPRIVDGFWTGNPFDLSAADLLNLTDVGFSGDYQNGGFDAVTLTFSLAGLNGATRHFRSREAIVSVEAGSLVLPDGTVVVDPPIFFAADIKNARAAKGGRASKLDLAKGHASLKLSVTEEVDESGNVVASEESALLGGEPISFGQLGSIFGSNLSRLVQTSDQWESIAVGTLIGTIGLNIGQEIDARKATAAGYVNADGIPVDERGNPIRGFDDFFTDLSAAGIGAIGSYLFAEFLNDAGVEGVAGELINTTAGVVIGQIADNIVAGVNPFSGIDFATLPNALGGFIGGYLARQLVEFDTIGGQIGAAIGSTLGTLYGAELLGKIGLAVWGPLGAAIGAFIGYIVGGLIGSLFGGTPKSGAGLGWDASEQRYDLTYSWSRHGGSADVAKSMATNVAELLNGVIAASGSRLNDAAGVQVGAYETKSGDFIYKNSDTGQYAYRTTDFGKVVNHGAFIALSDLSSRLMGGDVYLKRALEATLFAANGNRDAAPGQYAAGDFEAQTLLGNISTAQDYASYLQNASVINALIAAEPESAFTAGWTITFARVMELGLDRRWASDWRGGWAAFMDETMDGALDGYAFAPANENNNSREAA